MVKSYGWWVGWLMGGLCDFIVSQVQILFFRAMGMALEREGGYERVSTDCLERAVHQNGVEVSRKKHTFALRIKRLGVTHILCTVHWTTI